MNTLTIEYPSEVLDALNQDPTEFATQARLLLALKLYESGKLSTGLAARLADMPRTVFLFELGRYHLSPFGETPAELESDIANARRAARRASHRQ